MFVVTFLWGIFLLFFCETCAEEFFSVETPSGVIKGTSKLSENGYTFYAFNRIPFAKPPIGELRFKDPEPYPDWSTPLDATEDSPACIQLDMFEHFKLHGVEDCLYLNVYTKQIPDADTKSFHYHPVMVWIHGGGFFSGSGNYTTYGPQRIIDYDVILVTINYRLGPLGFLSTGDSVVPGNMGLKDQVMALKWVQKNIAAFGGNPNRVTIFGESAGARSAHLMQFSPLAKGLFHNVIAQSGTALAHWTNYRDPGRPLEEYATINGCPNESTVETVECLRRMNAEKIVQSSILLKEDKWNSFPLTSFGPIVEPESENAFMTSLPKESLHDGSYTRVPLMVGMTVEEGAFVATMLLEHPSLCESISANPTETLPYVLDYYRSGVDSSRLSQKIMEFYFPAGRISQEARFNLSKLFSDRTFTHPTVNCVKGQMEDSPVYMYKFHYKDRDGFVRHFTTKEYGFGASHFDEIQYLFRTVYYPNELNKEEKKISEILLELWTNFAKAGNPNEPFEKPIWLPLRNADDVTFLDIQLQPHMATLDSDMKRRLKFWEEVSETEDVD